MFVSMCACIYIYIDKQIDRLIDRQIHTHTHARTYTYTHIQTHRRIDIYVYVNSNHKKHNQEEAFSERERDNIQREKKPKIPGGMKKPPDPPPSPVSCLPLCHLQRPLLATTDASDGFWLPLSHLHRSFLATIDAYDVLCLIAQPPFRIAIITQQLVISFFTWL